jgi:hypothetical protein
MTLPEEPLFERAKRFVLDHHTEEDWAAIGAIIVFGLLALDYFCEGGILFC